MQLSEYMKELRKVKTLDRAQEAKLWAAFKERAVSYTHLTLPTKA